MKYVLAELSDLPAIRQLMAKYHRDTIAPEDMADGFVTTALSDEQFADLIVRERGVMLAKDGDKVAAFALAASWEYWQQVPIMQKMIDILPQMTAVDGVKAAAVNADLHLRRSFSCRGPARSCACPCCAAYGRARTCCR